MILEKKISNSKIKEFNKNGFVVIRGLIKKENIYSIKNNLEKFIGNSSNQFKKREINFTSNNKINSIHNLHKKWKFVNVIQNDNNLKKSVETLLGNKIDNFGSELFYKPAKNGLSAPIHQDNYFWCLDNPNAVTVWIALDFAKKENGGIFYFKKSQSLGLLEHRPSYHPGTSQEIKYPDGLKNFEKFYPNLQPGDCLIHHSLIAHGSNPNLTKNSRVGVTVRYKIKNSKIDKFLQKKYENELKNQLLKRA